MSPPAPLRHWWSAACVNAVHSPDSSVSSLRMGVDILARLTVIEAAYVSQDLNADVSMSSPRQPRDSSNPPLRNWRTDQSFAAADRCDDGILSTLLGETDVDCGGACADLHDRPCRVGKRCLRHADCMSGTCSGGGLCTEFGGGTAAADYLAIQQHGGGGVDARRGGDLAAV